MTLMGCFRLSLTLLLIKWMVFYNFPPLRNIYNYYEHFPEVFITLGVRSLANASRARQFNPLNPPVVGWVPLPQTNTAAVVGRAWSCAVVRAWSVIRGRAWSCAVGRAWSCGHTWSCGRAVLPASRPALPWHERTRTKERTNERTNEHLITH